MEFFELTDRTVIGAGMVGFAVAMLVQELSKRISLNATIELIKRHSVASWFAEKFTIPIFTGTAATLIAAGILYGINFITNGSLNNARPLHGVEPSVQAGEIASNDAKADGDNPDATASVDGSSGVRRQTLKPIVPLKPRVNYCKTHSNVPLEEFASLGNNDYQCKRCGQIGILAQSIEGSELLFIVDKE